MTAMVDNTHQNHHRRRLDASDASNASNASNDTTATSNAAAKIIKTCPSSTSTHLDPSSFGYYDAIYDQMKSNNFATSTRVGSVEVIPPQNPNPSDASSSSMMMMQTNQTYAIMKLITISALTSRGPPAESNDEKDDTATSKNTKTTTHSLLPRGQNGTQAYADLSGIILAIHHFNNGIGTIVPTLTNLHKTCPIRFALHDDFYDSESSQTVAASHFGNSVILNPERPPGALVGAYRSSVSVPLAILGGAYEIPMVSPLSTSSELDDKNVYKYFGRLIPSDAGTARGVVDYLKGLEVGHLGILYVNDPYGSNYYESIVKASFTRPPNDRIIVKGNSFPSIVDPAQDIKRAVRQLAKNDYRYFFGVFYSEHYETIMKYAYQYGIAGPGFVWIISDGLSDKFLEGRTYKDGTDLAIASQGVGIVKVEGGRETTDGVSGYDRFTKAYYEEQGGENVDYHNCKQPKTNSVGDTSVYYKASHDFFTGRQMAPTAGAVFTYDSTIGLGMAACQLYEERGDAYFGGVDLFNAFVSQSFEGATGLVKLDPETTSRDPKSAFFVLYNARGESDGKGNQIFSVKTVATSAPDPDSSNVVWVYNNEAYLYSDGTTSPPDALPPVEADLHHLSPGVRSVGLTVAALTFALALFFGVWTKRNNKERVIKASQPEFLYMICVGALVIGSTLIPLSVDDSVASAYGCDIACMSIPWLFNYGFTIVFSALFAKTWRLNKIMANVAERRKMKVKVTDALKPFIVLFTINTIVLVTWTELDPLEWVRIESDLTDGFGRSIDSYGICKSNHMVTYLLVLFVISFSLILLANYQVYSARQLSTEFFESKYISIIMASMFQAIVIGLPLSIIAMRDPVPRFIIFTFIIGAMSLSTLCFMFIPKIWGLRMMGNEEQENLNTINENVVVDTDITQVKADLEDEIENEENAGVLSSMLDGAKDMYRWTTSVVSDAGEGDGHSVMTGKSIFVGTVRSRESVELEKLESGL